MAVALGGTAFGAPIVTVKFVGPGTTVTDSHGTAVTPYAITINGSPQVVTCYDYDDEIGLGQSWSAYEYTLSEAISSGMFHTGFGDATIGYESVGWLSAQTYGTPAEEVGLQYAIWNVFEHDIPALTGDSLTAYNNYESALSAEVTAGFADFNFNHTTFLEPTAGVPQQAGTKQAFVFAITSGGGDQTSAPEPGTMVMIGSGLLCLLGSIGFKRFSRKSS